MKPKKMTIWRVGHYAWGCMAVGHAFFLSWTGSLIFLFLSITCLAVMYLYKYMDTI